MVYVDRYRISKLLWDRPTCMFFTLTCTRPRRSPTFHWCDGESVGHTAGHTASGPTESFLSQGLTLASLLSGKIINDLDVSLSLYVLSLACDFHLDLFMEKSNCRTRIRNVICAVSIPVESLNQWQWRLELLTRDIDPFRLNRDRRVVGRVKVLEYVRHRL